MGTDPTAAVPVPDSNAYMTVALPPCRLLSLPQEIKNQIYEYTTGVQLIHIEQRKKKGILTFHSHIRPSQRSLDFAQTVFDNAYQEKWNAPLLGLNHRVCFFSIKTLDLGVLRTCHQIYHEAQHVHYSTNTFSFDDAQTLLRFFRYLKKTIFHTDTLPIRSLHLYTKLQQLYDIGEIHRWTNKVFPNIASTLVNLRQIHVDIEPRHYDLRADPGMARAITKLAKLPLKQAVITIYDCDSGQIRRRLPRRWAYWVMPLSDKRTWVCDVKAKLFAKGQGG